MSIYEQIKDSLIKQNKILQVDYLGQKIIENSRQNFQEWQHIIPVTKKQKQLWQYLQKEDLHQQKYFRFKKTLNQKHLGLYLPQQYKHSTILTQKLNDLLYSPRKMVSSALGNSTMDTSGGHFVTGIDTIRQKDQRSQSRASTSFYKRSQFKQRKITSCKKQKNLSRYWPIEDNESFTFKQKDSFNIINSTKAKKLKQDRSIFNDSVNRSIKRSFDTIKSCPLSQQIQRHTDQVKTLVQRAINPQIRRQNIRHTIRSLTQKQKISQKKVKKERESILDTITNKDELMRFLRQSRSIDPKRKGIFSLDDLSQFEKFNLSFQKYVTLKSLKKINNYTYQNKVKQKTGNLQKFQNFILQQFGIESDNKRKLERIFEQIVWQCGRTQRRKQAQKR